MCESAFGIVDITPSESIELAGFAGQHRRFDDVHSRLESNFAFLRDDTSKHLLVSVDLLYPGILGALLTERLEDSNGRESRSGLGHGGEL